MHVCVNIHINSRGDIGDRPHLLQEKWLRTIVSHQWNIWGDRSLWKIKIQSEVTLSFSFWDGEKNRTADSKPLQAHPKAVYRRSSTMWIIPKCGPVISSTVRKHAKDWTCWFRYAVHCGHTEDQNRREPASTISPNLDYMSVQCHAHLNPLPRPQATNDF